jgi:predicted acyl esterase
VPPLDVLDGFFAKWLKGKGSKAYDRMPKIMSEAQDKQFRSTLPMTQKQTSSLLGHPAAGVGTIGGKPGGNGTFVNSGAETSKQYKANPTTQQGFTAYAGAPVKADTRLAGSGTVTLKMTCSLPRGQVAATLFDVGPESAAGKVITLGLLDLRFRDSLAVAKDVPMGAPFTAKVTLRPQDYVLAKGHHLVLTIAGSDAVWGVPDAVAGQQIAVLPGSVLSLPIGSAGSVLR